MCCWLLTCLFALIISVLINPETCSQVWFQLYVGHIQTGHTDFLPPRVCGRSWWGFQLGVKACLIQLIAWLGLHARIICWFLTCVYHNYWIRVHWSLNLSLGVIANFQWDVSKLDIQTCFTCRFAEDHMFFKFYLSPSMHLSTLRQLLKLFKSVVV